MKASDGRYRREATKTSGRVAVEKGSVRVARDPLLLPLLPLALLGCTCHSRSFEEPQTKEMILLDYLFCSGKYRRWLCASESAKVLAGIVVPDI